MTTPLGAGINSGDVPRWRPSTSSWESSIGALNGARIGLLLGWVDDDTISISPGACGFSDGTYYSLAAVTNATFAALDTGARAAGRDYAVYATPDGPKLVLITTTASGPPAGYTVDNSRLLGYFHNGKDFAGGSAAGAIFRYSVTSNNLLLSTTPYRAHPELLPGIPLPGMVKIGGCALGIYLASREDATNAAYGSSNYPTSRYGVVPWHSIQGWDAMAALRNAGCRMPTWEEWLGCVEWNPGSATPARMNGNTNSGASSDDAAQSGTADPTQAGRTLCGTGPRTTIWTAAKTGRSWYSPAGIADPVGNIWEWVGQFFGGLRGGWAGVGGAVGGATAWSSGSGYNEGDQAYNFLGQSYNLDSGGYTEGLPALLYVGGSWNVDSDAGVRAAGANYSAGIASILVGFRACR